VIFFDQDVEQRKAVDKTCFNESNEPLFRKIKQDIKLLLARPEYARFGYIGSGFQEKVDRLTLATQDVLRGIDTTLADQYIKVPT